jgi:hypothetical protein
LRNARGVPIGEIVATVPMEARENVPVEARENVPMEAREDAPAVPGAASRRP